MDNPFFKNNGPFKLSEILRDLSLVNSQNNQDQNIIDIKDLTNSKKNEITFFHSKKYKTIANITKASFCITTKNLQSELPKCCIPIIVDNVLISTSVITAKFYPDSIIDDFDNTVEEINNTKFNDKVEFGRNVLLGKNVSIGSNCKIGHNTIIEKNVMIGNNCFIGSNTIIRNTFIQNNVRILDNCVIGKHGFGFFPKDNSNLRYPHMGIVLIEDDCEIGCGSTIDRGSMSNTTIGKNTYLDNQIHIAHNVRIGKNSIITSQVRIAGSLKIGNNVEIAGGSGVIKDIPDNSKVMGYPAKNIREFLRDKR